MAIRPTFPTTTAPSFLLALAALSFAPALTAQNAPPVAPVRPVTDTYFGVPVTDPYRYMENLSDPDVAAWFKGQDTYTRGVLAKIPGRDALVARIRELDKSREFNLADNLVNRTPTRIDAAFRCIWNDSRCGRNLGM